MSAPAKPAADASATKKRRTLPLIVGLIVLLAGGGGGYFWWSKQQAVKAAAAASGGAGKEGEGATHGERDATADGHGESADGTEAGGGGLVPLNTFTVNLADTDARRFLRTDVQLVIDGTEEDVKHLEEEKVPVVRARAEVLELLMAQTSDVINTPEGKAALKTEIKKKAGKALHHKVTDVLFADFVIQF